MDRLVNSPSRLGKGITLLNFSNTEILGVRLKNFTPEEVFKGITIDTDSIEIHLFSFSYVRK